MITLADLDYYVDKWAEDKEWWWYVLPWLFFAWVFWWIATNDPYGEAAPLILYPFSMLMFGVHESAHLFTGWLPDILTSAAGSMSEITLGWLFIIGGLSTRSYFVSAMMFIMVMMGSINAGYYMADARAQAYGPGISWYSAFTGDTSQNIHDWEFVFDELGVIEHDTKIGWAFRAGGTLLGLFGLGLGLYLMRRIAKPKRVTVAESDNSQKVRPEPKTKVLFAHDPKVNLDESDSKQSD